MADPTVVVNPWMNLISAVAGGLVVGLFGVINNVINKRTEAKKLESEEREHLKELIFRTSIENWKQHNETAIELMKLNKSVKVMPFESHLVNLITLSDTLLETKLTKENAVAKVKEAFEISDGVDKYINDRFLAEKKEK